MQQNTAIKQRQLLSLPPKGLVVHSGTRSPDPYGKFELVRIRTGSPNPNRESDSRTRNGFVPFGRTRVQSYLLKVRILRFVLE
ncbi:hypothetical protein AVEN_106111-1 [Araneus ventricosus]|uniref:Uncharacterized protein n=1 Tax=Araneus ventricosus TaxID=182803 RepID=A0A4Y2LYC1_ARAVE|nr:hypothetical protein AVEN_106111-1 [Araneus ventricosus]